MDICSFFDRVGPTKTVLTFTLLATFATVVLTWFIMTVSGHSMSSLAWLLSAALPLLLVPAIAYKVIYTLHHLGRMEQKFRRLAMTDALTETLNRRGFLELAEPRFDEAKRRRQPVSAVVIDIDHFQKLNTDHGSLVGDQIMRAVARICRSLTRPGDLLARHGTEGLAFYLPDTNSATCQRFAEKLRQRLERTTVAHERLLLRLTVSVGSVSSEAEHEHDSLADLIGAAAMALSAARTGGTNRHETVPIETVERPKAVLYPFRPVVAGVAA
jgi:diguanylate cyclase (GGDEF)-like protein